MTKAIASYPVEQREAVILRRIKTASGGAGYWAARAAARKLGLLVPATNTFKPHAPRKRRGNSERDEQRARRRPVGFKPFKHAFDN